MSIDLKSYLQNILTEQELHHLVRSYDVVGDIAIIIIPEILSHREGVIGRAILDNNKRIKVVARRDGNYSGEFRTIPLKIIAGENRKETVHREYGVQLLLHPEEVYFSVRSGTERYRIARLVCPGEDVLVLFAGVAPYPLVISKNSQARAITAIEKNPRAVYYARKNLRLNRSIHNVEFLEGDVLEVIPTLSKRFDRLLMVLPHGGDAYLDAALAVLKPGGWLHFYSMQVKGEFHVARETVQACCNRVGLAFSYSQTVKCGHCGPRQYRICTEGRVVSRESR